jgi:hypothetical protein
MPDLFSDEAYEIPCPECGRRFAEKVGYLKTGPDLCCPSCKSTFRYKPDSFKSAADGMEDRIEKMLREFR